MRVPVLIIFYFQNLNLTADPDLLTHHKLVLPKRVFSVRSAVEYHVGSLRVVIRNPLNFTFATDKLI